MFKPGDIIEIKDDASYVVTKPGTKWLVYAPKDESGILRIGTLPFGEYNGQDMLRLYGIGGFTNIKRRQEAGVKLYAVFEHECKLSGNNAIFKDKLLQGDIWEEEKKKTWSRGKKYFTEGIDWGDVFKF